VAVLVKIPTQLRAAAEGTAETEVQGATVAEVLSGLYERLASYLGGEDIRFLDGLQTPVPDGAELTILPAVAGG
jgi:molybdopterin converting factor small subunit